MSDFDSLKIFSETQIDLSEKLPKKIGIPIGKAYVGRFGEKFKLNFMKT